MTFASYTRLQQSALVLLIICFGVLLYLTAWVADDAYITFRSIDNFVRGYGLRWNITERVQTFTHPLWLLVITGFYWLSGEPYYTSLALSATFSLLAVSIYVVLLSRTYCLALVAAAALILSKAFVDYSTSGLENPLSHLLVGLFCWLYLRWPDRRLGWLPLVVSIAALNRLDTLVSLLPPLLYAVKQHTSRKTIYHFTAGFLPLLAWEIFSLVYYGFFMPNTALAKLNVDLPRDELLRQGMYYLLDSLQRDPLTLFVIVSATVVALVSRSTKSLYLQAGVLLHLFYTLWAGGDFMSGRFMTLPFLISLATLITNPLLATTWASVSLLGLILVLGLSSPLAPLYSNQLYQTTLSDIRTHHGVADERGYYYPTTGLAIIKGAGKPVHPWVKEGQTAADRDHVVVRRSIGLFGYYAGPHVHVLDVYALGDPLLARLPNLSRRYLDEGTLKYWRVGHFRRSIPAGYPATLLTHRNMIKDSGLATYYDLLAEVTRGNLWSKRRLTAIWQLHTSASSLLNNYRDDEELYYGDNWSISQGVFHTPLLLVRRGQGQ